MNLSAENKSGEKPLALNWLTIFGFILGIVFLTGEVIIVTADIMYGGENPYTGILIYLVGPAILTASLLLVPLGIGLEYRRRKKGIPSQKLPTFDLNHPRHRLYLTIFTIVTTIFLAFTMIGSYKAYHVTESVGFCGLTCHQVMKPEYEAYQHSPHARVACVKCHIGPGASWFVKSKLSGAHQVIAVLRQSYKLPLDTPIVNLRPARDTCEQCHWPEKFSPALEKSLVYYGTDEENTPYQVDILLRVGGSQGEGRKAKGIHWHIGLDHKLEYYASDDDRQIVPWVRVTHNDGSVEEYVDSDAQDFDPGSIPPESIRTMDCIDCHNRPSHRYQSPFSIVNAALAQGAINPQLPEIKANLAELLQKDFKTTSEALLGIEKTLRERYADIIAKDASRQGDVDQAIQEAQRLYSQNVFPEYKVDWTKYPSNIGHFEFPGCYRCHNDRHQEVKTGKKISNDCNLCHTIIRQGEGWDAIQNLEYKQQSFNHPRGYGDGWMGQNCHECHGPGMM
ncbi:MAG: NapC/NirT family cytochrome c [Candidatus Omnitrophota bacterium]